MFSGSSSGCCLQMEQIFVPILVSDSEAKVVLLSLIKPENSEKKKLFCFIFPGVNIKRSWYAI